LRIMLRRECAKFQGKTAIFGREADVPACMRRSIARCSALLTRVLRSASRSCCNRPLVTSFALSSATCDAQDFFVVLDDQDEARAIFFLRLVASTHRAQRSAAR